MRVFLSGPITTNIDSWEEAKRRFSEAKRWAHAAFPGAEVVDPVALNPDPDMSRREAMSVCIGCLLSMDEGDVVLQLPGWEGSSGAACEAVVARQLGLTLVEAPWDAVAGSSEAA